MFQRINNFVLIGIEPLKLHVKWGKYYSEVCLCSWRFVGSELIIIILYVCD